MLIPINFPVPNLDLMNKGLRLDDSDIFQALIIKVPNLDLMNKGLRLFQLNLLPLKVPLAFQT